ncbi:MAG: glycosyltransferase family 2 protein, partial [Candidatus Wolfebacteria bacterium]|nr:glycosyltransferase family 2 protein [Candidatus Wolfebacteria bacterium]
MEHNMNNLDVIIPVYNEGENIGDALNTLGREVRTSIRVFIVYDFDEDNTLPAVRQVGDLGFEVRLVKNRTKGVHEAIMTGFEVSDAEAVMVYPADESYNAVIIDRMYAKFKEGNDIVVASRLMKGGEMKGGPFVKSMLVRAASRVLKWFVGLPASDATYGMRLMSRKLLDTVEIESVAGWTYAIELLVKCHRLRWKVAEVPAKWLRREKGQS